MARASEALGNALFNIGDQLSQTLARREQRDYEDRLRAEMFARQDAQYARDVARSDFEYGRGIAREDFVYDRAFVEALVNEGYLTKEQRNDPAQVEVASRERALYTTAGRKFTATERDLSLKAAQANLDAADRAKRREEFDEGQQKDAVVDIKELGKDIARVQYELDEARKGADEEADVIRRAMDRNSIPYEEVQEVMSQIAADRGYKDDRDQDVIASRKNEAIDQIISKRAATNFGLSKMTPKSQKLYSLYKELDTLTDSRDKLANRFRISFGREAYTPQPKAADLKENNPFAATDNASASTTAFDKSNRVALPSAAYAGALATQAKEPSIWDNINPFSSRNSRAIKDAANAVYNTNKAAGKMLYDNVLAPTVEGVARIIPERSPFLEDVPRAAPQRLDMYNPTPYIGDEVVVPEAAPQPDPFIQPTIVKPVDERLIVRDQIRLQKLKSLRNIQSQNRVSSMCGIDPFAGTVLQSDYDSEIQNLESKIQAMMATRKQ